MTHDAVAALLARRNVARILAVLDGDGEETRIVGGAVRNALLGLPVGDVDLATTALPETVFARAKAAGFKPVPTGIEHGTVTVVVEGEPFEVTTLREDIATDGRRAKVRFGRDFARDAARRDFTLNALSLGADRTLHDSVGGLADLEARRIVFIGDPRQRIREDFLRILRFFRFHAHYGEGPLDPAGLAAAIAERDGLAVLSRERVRSELLKLLAARGAVAGTTELVFGGFLAQLTGAVGELGRLRRVVAWERGSGEAADPVRRLAALAVMTAEDADRLTDRLRLSKAESERLGAYAAALARVKTDGFEGDGRSLRRLIARFGLAAASDLIAATAGEPGIAPPEALRSLLAPYASGEKAEPVFPVKGADLLAAGMRAGPEIGERLERARSAWIAEGCPEGAEAAARFRALALE